MNMASAEETQITGYDQNNDPFYAKATIYATWVMIYIGSTEAWWKPDHERGCSIKVDGKWQSMNWNNERVLLSQCKAIRDAGINVIGYRVVSMPTYLKSFRILFFLSAA